MSGGLLRPGDEVERLLILEELGRGARGVIYKAYDPRLDRTVALKLLQDRPDDDTHARARKRLVKEAQAMAQLSHANVVTVHDVGTVSLEDRVRVYIEMEYVRGRSLAEQMKAWKSEAAGSRSSRWREVLDPFLQAGEGLAAAHDHQLVHRDFKPANVLVDQSGRAMVTDFGLVRRAGEPDASVPTDPSTFSNPSTPASTALDVPLTQTGVMVGTPAYMAPEQLAGRNGDARSDQFAFCVALYEALHGQRPFAGHDVAQLTRAVLEDDPRPPGANAVAVPRFVDRAIRRGLSRDPQERHPSMHALLDRLRADPRVRVRRGLGVLGLVIGGMALALGLRWWLEPGVLALSIEGSSGPPVGARVEIDGEPVALRGESPTFELAAGLHHIRVEAPDHKPYEHPVELRRGQALPLSIVLQHQIGRLDLEVPQGARLRLDQDERGSSLEGLELDTGHHELRVSVPGRHEARLTFELGVNERVDLTAHLAPGIVFQKLGGGLPLGRGALGDADGDGHGDIWDHTYTTLSAYSPTTGQTLWRTNISRDGNAQFLVIHDLDGDGVLDPVIAGVDESGAVLRALDGRHGPDGSPRWSAALDPIRRRPAPLVPPEVVELGGIPVVLATSLERDTVTAYDGRIGATRWSESIAGPVFGLVTGTDPDGAWVVLAHTDGITCLDVDTGRRRWGHEFEHFGPALIEGLQADHRLIHRGRGVGSWMISTPIDDDPGDDLLLTNLLDSHGGPLLGLGGREGVVRWTGPVVDALTIRDVGDLDDDQRGEVVATRLGPEGRANVIIDGRSGSIVETLEPGEQIERWPCDGATHLFGSDERGPYIRRMGNPTRAYPFGFQDDLIQVRCTDWDGDGDDEVVLATHRLGLRAYDSTTDGDVLDDGAIAVPRRIDDIVPLGDIDGDARPDFLLEAGGPLVVRGSRVLWARSYRSALWAAPVVDDFDGDDSLDVAVFNGFLEQSYLEQLAAADGRRVRSAPSGRFSLRAPTVVPGLHPDTKDLVFPGPEGSVVRVQGSDFSVHHLDVRPALPTYAGITASADGRTLWMTSWETGPHLRAMTAPPGAWIPESSTLASASEPWHEFFALRREFGGWPRPRLLQIDADDTLEVAATIDRGRLLVIDPDSNGCRWSRWMSPIDDRARVRWGPGVFDLDDDGRDEILAASSTDATDLAPSCARSRTSPAPKSTPDLVALNGHDGTIRWRLPDGGSPRSSPVDVQFESARWLVGASPVLGLYAVGLDGNLHWTVPVSDLVNTPLSVGDVDGNGVPEVAFGTRAGAVQVHDAVTGALRWSWSPPDPSSQSAAPVLADLDGDGDDEVLLATGSATLYALDGAFAPVDVHARPNPASPAGPR